jgi:hypothetical protein
MYTRIQIVVGEDLGRTHLISHMFIGISDLYTRFTVAAPGFPEKRRRYMWKSSISAILGAKSWLLLHVTSFWKFWTKMRAGRPAIWSPFQVNPPLIYLFLSCYPFLVTVSGALSLMIENLHVTQTRDSVRSVSIPGLVGCIYYRRPTLDLQVIVLQGAKLFGEKNHL